MLRSAQVAESTGPEYIPSATNLYRIGVSARTIQAILRHSNVSTTLAFYVKTSGADAVAAMERLEKEMGNDWATATSIIVQ